MNFTHIESITLSYGLIGVLFICILLLYFRSLVFHKVSCYSLEALFFIMVFCISAVMVFLVKLSV
ncbi:MAG: hypothetical protein HON94_16180 [Methylococcales bacterium]|jgi:hypothetical protein|nr:hypothetical protein [Methylococcales bacterium]